jgi:hypothetical protein
MLNKFLNARRNYRQVDEIVLSKTVLLNFGPKQTDKWNLYSFLLLSYHDLT